MRGMLKYRMVFSPTHTAIVSKMPHAFKRKLGNFIDKKYHLKKNNIFDI